MGRPPDPVKRLLRKEVNYGCPVPGCGSPLLTWHHFNPPLSVKEHDNPGGMIALCQKHHDSADAGLITDEELRRYKKCPNSLQTIQELFPWIKESSLFRLGGCYAAGGFQMIVGDVPVLSVKKDKNQLTTLSFRTEDDQGVLLAEMNENVFTAYPEKVRDLSIAPSRNRIKVWSGKERKRIGFECHYSLVNREKLEEWIKADFSTCPKNIPTPKPIEDLDEFYNEIKDIEPSEMLGGIPKILVIAHQRRDPVGTYIRWHAVRFANREGEIPVVNFLSCRFYNKGMCIELRNGRLFGERNGLQFNLGFSFGTKLLLSETQFLFS